MEVRHITYIRSRKSVFDFDWTEFFSYFGLIWIFTKRNYSTRYKQTILGPAWLFISPALTVFAYSIVFGGIAGLSTDGVPKPIYYMAGVVLWNFFTGIITETSNTFINNSGILGKIYFPRLILPLSTALTKLFDLIIQMSMLVVLFIFYAVNGYDFTISIKVLYLPLIMIYVAILALGVGLILASVTTKYRDLMVLVGFGLQIWMYATPIVYSLDLVPTQFRSLYLLNPMTFAVLTFRNILLCTFEPNTICIVNGVIVALLVFTIGFTLFNRAEKDFMDVI